MAPTIRTAEYTLLTQIRDEMPTGFRLYDRRNMLRVNDVALKQALHNTHVDVDKWGFATLTHAGFERLDELEDR